MDREENPTRIAELSFTVTAKLQDDVLERLFGHSDTSQIVEERGFIGLIQVGMGVRRRTIHLRSIVAQDDGWVTSGFEGLRFSHLYFRRAIELARAASPTAGVIVVHSHPGPRSGPEIRPRPSSADLHTERDHLWSMARGLESGAPVAAGIVAPSGSWRVREYWWPQPTSPREAKRRRYRAAGGSYRDASLVKIVGARSVRYVGGGTAVDVPASTSLDSTLRLWGTGGHRILTNLSVGVAGAGGVGSYVVEALARLGVGRLVLVDYDTLEFENLNRSIGATTSDVGKPKVSYLKRLARKSSTCPGFEIRVYRESVAEWGGIRPLLDCDVILAAADSPVARQVLDHASYAYEIPVIDGGTVFIVDKTTGRITGKSQVSEAGPGSPCLECQGVYTREEATIARESPELQGPNPYLRVAGEESATTPRAPSVVSHNALVASLMVQRMLRLILAFPPEEPRFQQRFYVELGEMKWGPKVVCDDDCPKAQWSGLGDAHWLPVGVDPLWKQTQETEAKSLRPRANKRQPS